MFAGSVSVNWTVSDNFGVAKINIYVNGSLVATLSGTARTYALTLSAGVYNISVVAYDNAGNTASDSIIIEVTSAPSGGAGLPSSTLAIILGMILIIAVIGFIVWLRRK